jgi:hypothetical protein
LEELFLDYEKLLKTSFYLLKKDLGTYLVATFILFFGSIFMISFAPLTYGYNVMAIKSLRNEKVKITDILEGFKLRNFFRSWVLTLCMLIPYFIIALINSALAYLVFFFLIYTMPLLILRGYGGFASCKESIKIATQYPIETILVTVLYIVMINLGTLALIIGLFVATPFAELFITGATFELIGEGYIDSSQDKVEVMQIEAITS